MFDRSRSGRGRVFRQRSDGGEKSPVKIESAWSKSGRQGLRVVVAEGDPIIA